jgi:hypothetical protein
MEFLQTVELHPKKIEELNQQPILETFMQVSEDGKWFIHKTVITDIKPRKYMDKVFGEE